MVFQRQRRRITMMTTMMVLVSGQLIDFDIVVSPGAEPSRFTVRVREDWAPIGAARLIELVENEHYDGCSFFRVIGRFMAQFGISGNPTKQAAWRRNAIDDETLPKNARGSNRRGTVTFAHAGPNTRSTQLFINLVDNTRLDPDFPPIGQVVEGMDVVDAIRLTGEGGPRGPGPSQNLIQQRGDAYLTEKFPELSKIIKARIRRQDAALRGGGQTTMEDSRPSSSPWEGWPSGFALTVALVILVVLCYSFYYCATSRKNSSSKRPNLMVDVSSLTTPKES